MMSRALLRTAALVVALGWCTTGVQVHQEKRNALCENINHHCCTENEVSDHGKWAEQPPVVFFAGSCSGSTAVMEMAYEIASATNHSVLNCDGGFELLADIDSGYYGEDHKDLSHTMLAFHERALKTNRRLMFKAESRFAKKDVGLMKVLGSLNAKLVTIDRWNKLDVAVCATRDCFKFTKASFGHLVDEEGANKSCAFRGRLQNETIVAENVHVDIKNLKTNLKELMDLKNENAEFLMESNLQFQRLFYEDLFAFESGKQEDLKSSTAAWLGFMTHLGLKTQFEVIRLYLQESRKQLTRANSQFISNLDDVEARLGNCETPECGAMVKMIQRNPRQR